MYALSLEIIKSCNLNCSYCYLGEKENSRMPIETAYKAIDLAAHEATKQNDKTLHVYFIGGEPLLAFQMMQQCCKYAEKICEANGVHVAYSTTTNGTLLNEKIIDFFVQKNFDLKLSIDGNEIEHDANRIYVDGKGSHKAVVDKMDLIVKYERKTNKKVHAAQVICKNTCMSLTKSLKYLYELGFSVVESAVNFYESWDEVAVSVLLNEVREAFRFYKKLKENGSEFYWKFIEARIQAFCCESPCIYACRAGVASALITVDGKIYPCTESDERVCIGDVDHGLNVKKIRELMTIFDSRNPVCLACSEYKHCPACQCIMINYDLYKDFYKVPAVECKLTQFIFKLFREELSKQQKDAFRKQYCMEGTEYGL